MIKLLIVYTIAVSCIIPRPIPLPPDKRPDGQMFTDLTDDLADRKDFKWLCGALECKGHPLTADFGCKTDLLSEVFGAIKMRMQNCDER